MSVYEFASPNTETRETENRIVSMRKLPNLHTRDAHAQRQHFFSKTGLEGEVQTQEHASAAYVDRKPEFRGRLSGSIGRAFRR